jgi:hypothetical protein
MSEDQKDGGNKFRETLQASPGSKGNSRKAGVSFWPKP